MKSAVLNMFQNKNKIFQYEPIQSQLIDFSRSVSFRVACFYDAINILLSHKKITQMSLEGESERQLR